VSLPMAADFSLSGRFHAADLPYLFDLLGKDLLANKASHRLARTMVADWTSFAHSGRPSAPDVGAWPRYRPGSGRVLQLRPGGVHEIDFAREHRCGFWRGVGS
jgi:para-nitrobenzyl esterase